jgi:hypothetical protein
VLQRTVKAIIALVFLPLAVTAVMTFIRESDPITALILICKSPAFLMIPAPGWGAAALTALLQGRLLTGGLFLALTAATITGLLIFLFRSKSNYYEDVLVATKSAFEKKQAIAEGRLGLVIAPNRKIRITRTGISGFGARALFGKHLCETFRGSRLGFIDKRTIIYTAFAAVFSFYKRDAPENSLLLILQYFALVQIFTIAMGPSLRELYTPFIYLMPEPSFKKLIWNSLTVVLKAGVDAILIFGIAGIILRENPLIIAGVIITSTLFALMLTGVNIFCLRWTSMDVSTGILVIIYLFAVIIVLLPGLIPAFIISYAIPGDAGIITALKIVSLWEIAVSFLCFSLSKSILERCDMPVMKMPK